VKFLAKIAFVVAVAASGLALSVQPAAAINPSDEARFLDLVNQERAARGLVALVPHAELTDVARAWTDKMVGDGTISHNPNLAAQAPSGWQRLGENVGMGGNVQTLHEAFMNSPGHRANVLGDFNQAGIGVTYAPNGTLFVTVNFMKVASAQVLTATSCGPATNPAGSPSAKAAAGYYVLGDDGGIFAYGGAAFRGSVPSLGLRADAILVSVTPSQQGYYVLGADGGIFSFGDARFFGSLPGVGVRTRAIDLKPTPSGNGYWVLGADGGLFSFGDATFFGSLPGVGVRNQAIKLVPTPSGKGYWIVGADGGIFSFGDARFHGSLPGIGVANRSISMAATPSGNGYWVLGADGGIFSFGDARFFGSVPGTGGCGSVTGVQIVRTRTGAGYYVLSDRGAVYAFGDAPMYGAPAGLGVTTRDLAVVAP
jgi:hypothetical protein